MLEKELEGTGLTLERDACGLVLSDGTMELRSGLASMVPRLRRDRLSRELVVRAARVRGVAAPTAVDATAGLGQDSLLLAAAGFSVTLLEYDPVIWALLDDGLSQAADDPQLAEAVGRMTARQGDSIEFLHQMASEDGSPDVVLLDPMFPGRSKSAAVHKKFQLLHHLERPCEDEEELLDAALGVHPRKVVIKRPAKGPWLAGKKPSYTLKGKAVRYDVVVP